MCSNARAKLDELLTHKAFDKPSPPDVEESKGPLERECHLIYREVRAISNVVEFEQHSKSKIVLGNCETSAR